MRVSQFVIRQFYNTILLISERCCSQIRHLDSVDVHADLALHCPHICNIIQQDKSKVKYDYLLGTVTVDHGVTICIRKHTVVYVGVYKEVS